MSPNDLAPDVYNALLADVRQAVERSRARAARKVANELVEMSWTIGRAVVERQQAEGWGAKVIDRLARDLRLAFPEMTGLSRTNLHLRPSIGAGMAGRDNCPTACWTIALGSGDHTPRQARIR